MAVKKGGKKLPPKFPAKKWFRVGGVLYYPRLQDKPLNIMSKSKYICWTYNNPKENPQDILKRAEESGKVDYLIFQREKGDNGTEHFQGYIEFKTSQRYAAVHKIVAKEIHCETRRGTQVQAIDYCKKEESRLEGPWEFGEFKEKRGPGQRNDLTKLRDDVLGRKRKRKEIIDSCCNNQQLRFVENLYKYVQLDATYKPKRVVWCYGKTGEGKTKHVMTKVSGKDYYMADTAQWMDGYYGQPIVVIDELRAKDWPYARLLKLLDGYEILTAIKGGYVIWHPEKIYITTPFKPEDTYHRTAHLEGGIGQLLRRITKIKLFGPENPRVFDQIEIMGQQYYK